MIAKPRLRPLFAEQRTLRQQAGRTRYRAVASAAERIRTAARLRRRKDRRRRRRRRRRGRSASIPPDGELVFGTAQIQRHRVEARPGGVRMLGLSGVPILDDVVAGPLDLTTRTVFLGEWKVDIERSFEGYSTVESFLTFSILCSIQSFNSAPLSSAMFSTLVSSTLSKARGRAAKW